MNLGACESCPLVDCLGEQGKPISHRGPLDAPVVVIGSAPTQDDVDSGAPFSGASGQHTRDTLATVGFDPKQILWLNVCWCRPTGKLEVDSKSIKACAPNVDSILGAHKRSVIICLGAEAAAAVYGLRSIKGSRANCGAIRRCEKWDCWGVSVVSPAFVLRSPAWKPEFEMALRRAYELFTTGEPKQPNISITRHSTADEFVNTLQHMQKNAVDSVISFDIETDATRTGPTTFKSSYQEDNVLGVGFAWKEVDPFAAPEEPPVICATYIPFHHGPDSKPVWDANDWAKIYNAMGELFNNTGVKLTGHNLKYDCRNLMHQYGFRINPWFDTMVAHRLLDETKPKGLKFLGRLYLNAPDWDVMDTIPVGQHLGWYPMSDVGDYCCYDCAYTLLLSDVFLEEMEGTSFENLMFHLDMPLFNELTNVELRGMLVDRSACNKALAIIEEEIQNSAQDVDILSGWAGKILPHKEKVLKSGAMSSTCQIGVNASSSLDVGFIMYNHFGLSLPSDLNDHLKNKHTKKDGQTKTDNTTIQYMIGQGVINNESESWDFIQAMLKYRSLKTLRGYVRGVIDHTYPDGRVHTNFGFKQGSVELQSPVTGRLSSNSPSMQNVTKPLRPCWVAEPGHVFIESDYSALEIRVLAYMSQDQYLFEALDTGDFHSYTAAAAFGIPAADVTKEQRGAAKCAIFALCYGSGAAAIGRTFGWPKDECERFLDRIYNQYPKAKAFLDGQVTQAMRNGWVETMFGRRRRLPEVWSKDKGIKAEAERQAKNSPIQGGASELCSLAMLRLVKNDDYLRFGAYPCLTVHDSIVSQATVECADDVKAVQEYVMCQPPFQGFNVPLLVETDVSYRWGGEFNIDAIRSIGE